MEGHPISAFWSLLLLWLTYFYFWPSLFFKRAPSVVAQPNVELLVVKKDGVTSFSAKQPGKATGSHANRNVLITGASQGIGRELALLYSHLGCSHVIIASRNVEHLETVARECVEACPSVTLHVVPFDASKEPSSTQLLMDQTLAVTQGILDIVVLNHIKPCYVPLLECDEPTKLARDCATVNYIAYVDLATRAIPHLAYTAKRRWKQNPGQLKSQIIAVSSLAGRVPLPNVHAYGASKAALNGWFSDLRVELLASPLYKDLISVTTCLLSAIDTEGFRETAAKDNPKVMSIAARAADAAYFILQASQRNARPGAIRFATQGEEFFPPYTGLIPVLAALSPQLAGWIVDMAHRTGNEHEQAERQKRLQCVAKWAIPIEK